ncbi:hypothetical protein M409DRAFT_70791 [Zasmidium cellare ATCC 36951]|uniref:Aldehyde dehydrogenase domain-containing protein n=1 Tax=Zasmidium cellare ATCC 36951 TaxID=1080233 RepID=A0A6A6BYD8_ZASCE|nr:uncharacterized protein M409DRAFT_70791 [Zasmidium cellare ATCC 36951]KAF2159725.1 hypothetical protein M409DRAFT_70791 [Zasmidium cellare ATCC 36951]
MSTSTASPVPLWIGNQPVSTINTFDVVSAINEKVLYKSASAGIDEATAAAVSAQKASAQWSKTTPAERRKIFNTEEGTGQDHLFSMKMVLESAEYMREVASRISTAVEASSPTVLGRKQRALVLKKPYGVIFGIAPWNNPYPLGGRAFSFALAAGNSVVLKGSENSPKSALIWGELFKLAGLPPGCLNIIYHRPQDAGAVTAHLVAHPAIGKINFTGSTLIGSTVAKTAGEHAKPTLMELGGKEPAIVLADADLHKAAAACFAGALSHAGQICMSTERILVLRSVAHGFVKALQEVIEKDFSQQQFVYSVQGAKKIRGLIRDALRKGARLAYGDERSLDDETCAMTPLITVDVPKNADLYYTESFGPSASIFVVDTDDEAVELANDTAFGLSSSVFSEDLNHALTIANRIEAGATHINTMTIHDEATLPHGGVKASGFRRFGGNYGFEEFLTTKTITWTV